MLSLWLLLLVLLAVIVAASQLFTNALEHVGQRSGISAGVTGSIFAAVATALPETMIPLLALFVGTSDHTVNEEISTGAILGAPLMLSTLSTLVMTLSVLRQRGWFGYVKPEATGFVRDLHFFLVAFFLAAAAMFVPRDPLIWRACISAVLIALYVFYVGRTVRASKRLVTEGHGVEIEEPLYFTKLRLPNTLFTLVLQLVAGLVLLVVGAKGFIWCLTTVAHVLNLPVLVLSLVIVPIATELPEKVNSVFWLRQGKDTLAMGNITGAMVFQGTILPALGVLLTPWEPTPNVCVSIAFAWLAALWLRVVLSKRGLSLWSLMVNGGLYILYLVVTFGVLV